MEADRNTSLQDPTPGAGPDPVAPACCCSAAAQLGFSTATHSEDHTANSFPLGSTKWKRRPPGNAKGS